MSGASTVDMRIRPGTLSGALHIPPSKSASHRALLCAALAEGESAVSPLVRTDDMEATLRAVRALGARARESEDGGRLLVTGIGAARSGGAELPAGCEIDCGESGSTLRFLVPVAAALGVNARFLGRGRLHRRPMKPLIDALRGHGVEITTGGVPWEILSTKGRLESGAYTVAGDVSSQYVTGLLYALPLLEGESEIVLSTPLASRGYVDMTLQMLARFGADIRETETGWRVPGGQRLRARDTRVEGDFSSAAFWLCAGALGSRLTLTGLDPESLQGDRAAIDILRRMGARIEWRDGALLAAPPELGELTGCEIDATHIPDLVPALAAVAVSARGTTSISGAARLRAKESDRLRAVSEGLRALGAAVEETGDGLIITGRSRLAGGVVDSFADHRIAMAMSVAALRCAGPVTVTDTQCVNKSYPDFYRDFISLGGACDVL